MKVLLAILIGILILSTSSTAEPNDTAVVTFETKLICGIGELWCFKMYIYQKGPYEKAEIALHNHTCTVNREFVEKLDLSFPPERKTWDEPAHIESYVLHNCSYIGRPRVVYRKLRNIDNTVVTSTRKSEENLTNNGIYYRGTFQKADEDAMPQNGKAREDID